MLRRDAGEDSSGKRDLATCVWPLMTHASGA